MYNFSICLLIKDENKYISEWITHHLSIGAEHFYIYDNNSKIPISETALGKFDKSLFTFIDWSDKYQSMQIEAYNHCIQNYKNESKWLAFIDTDEFIQWDSVSVLDKYDQYDFVRIPWVLFNANGHLKYDSKPVQERFTQTFDTDKIGCKFKSIVQPTRIKRMDVHYAIADNSIDADDIKLNHYYTRSLEEWEDKIVRGSCGPCCLRRYDEFFEHNPDLIEYKSDFLLERQSYQFNGYLFDVRIMAHPSRRDNVLKILNQLGMDESIVSYDDREGGGDSIYTAEKAWRQPVANRITHRIVLQDDIVLCNNFLKVMGKIINDLPDFCISLFNGIPVDLRKTGKDNPYVKVMELCGPGIILPVKYIEDCWDWINEQKNGDNYCPCDDQMIRKYCEAHDIEIYSTIPLTIQHIGDTEYKSLLNVSYFNTRISGLYNENASENILSYRKTTDENRFYKKVLQKRIEKVMNRNFKEVI